MTRARPSTTGRYRRPAAARGMWRPASHPSSVPTATPAASAASATDTPAARLIARASPVTSSRRRRARSSSCGTVTTPTATGHPGRGTRARPAPTPAARRRQRTPRTPCRHRRGAWDAPRVPHALEPLAAAGIPRAAPKAVGDAERPAAQHREERLRHPVIDGAEDDEDPLPGRTTPDGHTATPARRRSARARRRHPP